jgi:hypothetical protein
MKCEQLTLTGNKCKNGINCRVHKKLNRKRATNQGYASNKKALVEFLTNPLYEPKVLNILKEMRGAKTYGYVEVCNWKVAF